MAILLASLSALMYGCGDFAGGAASRKNSAFTVVLISQLFGTAVAVAAAPFLGSGATVFDFLFGGFAGMFGSFGLLVLYKGIASKPVAVVSPMSAVVGALVPMTFGIATGEQPSSLVWIGSFLCIPAILLLSVGKGGIASEIRGSLLYGLLAGIGFGGFFIAISRTGSGAGLWPLVSARAVSMSIVFAASLIGKQSIRPNWNSLLQIAAAGLFDMAANIAFMLAARRGMLILVSVITSLYPAPTVILAKVFFKQTMGILKIAGLVFAIAGMACISAGGA